MADQRRGERRRPASPLPADPRRPTPGRAGAGPRPAQPARGRPRAARRLDAGRSGGGRPSGPPPAERGHRPARLGPAGGGVNAASGGGASDPDRLARAALSRIVDPETEGLGKAGARYGASAVWAVARGEGPQIEVRGSLLNLLRKHAAQASPEADLARAAQVGARFVCPQDEEWPVGLSVLGEDEPLALWVRGEVPLADTLER